VPVYAGNGSIAPTPPELVTVAVLIHRRPNSPRNTLPFIDSGNFTSEASVAL
jgi:hypothetical protein